MSTFDYPVPDWAAGPAECALDGPPLGGFAGTLFDILTSVLKSGIGGLPARSAESPEFSLDELLFLQRYPLTHMTLVDRKELAEDDLEPWMVPVHPDWLLQAAEVYATMAHNLQVRDLPFPDGFGTSQAWIKHLELMAHFAQDLVSLASEGHQDDLTV